MSDGTRKEGLFIAFEGIDGAGTTTQAEKLVSSLEEQGRHALLTREPTGGPIGSVIRTALEGRLVAPDDRDRSPSFDHAMMALLFAADRLDHLEEEIIPALKGGTDVVTDRYLCSSLAYQSISLPLEWVHSLNKRAMMPALTIFLRVPVDVALHRIEERQGGVRDIYENRSVLEQVANGYEEIFAGDLISGVVVLDGTLPIEVLAEKVQHAVFTRLQS